MLASWKLLFSLFLVELCGTSAASQVEVYAYTGGDAKVSCSYPAGYETYEKYLCTEACTDNDVLVKTTKQTATRYSTSDHQQTQIFTVTISSVQMSDAGNYWCGVSRSGKDIYTSVTVHVKSNDCCDSVRNILGYEGNNVSISCPPQNDNSFKYMCKGSQPSACRKQALVTTSKTQNGQFRLRESESEFTVELSAVTKQDAGSYLCGVERSNAFDVFSRVDLTVKEWCCVTPHDVEGFLGQSVTLQCPYPDEHRPNTKFLCKGDKRTTCQTVVSSRERKDRFRLQDTRSSSSFSVTITGLTQNDAGAYWCGSDSQWTAEKNYSRIQLTLNGGTMSLRIILYVVPGLLLILVVVTSVIVYKYSCLRTQDERESNKIRSAKEEISINEVYSNHAPSKVKKFHRGDDWCVPQDETLYENFSNVPIYGNC
ncbi:polymeric immunoglobulin receptor-like [Periophthalmus magnuspinnatus]|uniref:polymeric immunoglobulin receptor-like n=1 Tax=Periophthalmus magnuspinnatus TaxID=409849 RepID=UPI002436572E|nr:polymeric immunoglobulin receptor-like [Periophthalmus magnuspinnatus]